MMKAGRDSQANVLRLVRTLQDVRTNWRRRGYTTKSISRLAALRLENEDELNRVVSNIVAQTPQMVRKMRRRGKMSVGAAYACGIIQGIRLST